MGVGVAVVAEYESAGSDGEDDMDEDEDEVGEVGEEVEGEDEVMPLGAVENEEDEEDEEQEREAGTRARVRATAAKMNISLRDVDIKDGKVIVAGREEVGRTEMEGMSPLTRRATTFPYALQCRI